MLISDTRGEGELIRNLRNYGAAILAAVTLSACISVGPEFETPEAPVPDDWESLPADGLVATKSELVEWWSVFNDPVVNELVELAQDQNYSLQIAGLRVLEARAQLGIATGLKWPQQQQVDGGVVRVSPSENAGGGSTSFNNYDLGLTAAWEMDFWGKYRRGIESADAALMASMANYDEAVILLTAQVVDTYVLVRQLQEQLRIARFNLELQQRSYDITDVLYRNGDSSELDVQQALTLLLSTKASVPELEKSVRLAENALDLLLSQPPGTVRHLIGDGDIPSVSAQVAMGIPADLLRRRPDVRSAELLAVAQNALVGVATADLYPSIALTGTLGLSSISSSVGGGGTSDFFSSDSLTYTAGAVFNWPFLNYGRIRNNIRVQDARLQQTLVGYQTAVLAAVKEVDDAMVSLAGAQAQNHILEDTVAAAERSNELSMLQYQEGFAGYQRVLDAQRALFNQQNRFASSRSEEVRSLIALYRALGGGWEIRDGKPFVNENTVAMMKERTNWGDLLDDE